MKSKSNSNLVLLVTAALVVVAAVYFWRKKSANAPVCQEICFSTGEETECDVICTPAETVAPAAE
jgi:hypothetical protein